MRGWHTIAVRRTLILVIENIHFISLKQNIPDIIGTRCMSRERGREGGGGGERERERERERGIITTVTTDVLEILCKLKKGRILMVTTTRTCQLESVGIYGRACLRLI